MNKTLKTIAEIDGELRSLTREANDNNNREDMENGTCPTCGAMLIFSRTIKNRLCRKCLQKLNSYLLQLRGGSTP